MVGAVREADMTVSQFHGSNVMPYCLPPQEVALQTLLETHKLLLQCTRWQDAFCNGRIQVIHHHYHGACQVARAPAVKLSLTCVELNTAVVMAFFGVLLLATVMTTWLLFPTAVRLRSLAPRPLRVAEDVADLWDTASDAAKAVGRWCMW